MKPYRFISLGEVATLIVIPIACIFISFFIVETYAIKKFEKSEVNRLLSTLYNIQNEMQNYLNPLSRQRLEEYLARYPESLDLRITVMDSSGKVVADTHADPDSLDNHSDRKEFKLAIQSGIGTAIRFSRTLDKKMMYVAIPIKDEVKFKGVIRASIPYELVAGQFHTARSYLVIFLALLTVILASSIIISMGAGRLKLYRTLFTLAEMLDRSGSKTLDKKLGSVYSFIIQHISGFVNKCDAVEKQENRNLRILDTIMKNSSDGILILDSDAIIIDCNGKIENYFNIKCQKVKGKLLSDVIRILPVVDYFAVQDKDFQYFESELEMRSDSGSSHLLLRIAPIKLVEGRRPEGFIVILRDIGELKRIEKAKKEFISNLAHEIKTPLTSIKAATETLAEGISFKKADYQHLVEIIQRQVKRLEGLLKGFTTLSKLEALQQSGALDRSRENIYNLIKEAMEMCQDMADKNQIELNVEGQKDIYWHVNSSLLLQGLMNLLENAIQFSPPGGNVWVSFDVKDQELEIIIRDQGYGIDKQHLNKIFERFYRVDSSRSRETGGSGLGLAIVKNIIDAHNGRILVESELGKGSTFRLLIPPQ